MPGPFQPQNVNFIAGINPELYQRQQALSQQQALAQQMMGEGLETINPTRMAGRFVVPISPLEGAAHAGKAIAAAMMQRNINKQQADVSAQQMQAIAQYLRDGQRPQQPQQPVQLAQNGVSDSSAGAVGAPWAAASTLPQPAPQSAPQAPQRDPLADYMRLGLIGQTFGPAAASVYAKSLEPTDLQKNIEYAKQFPGAPTPQAALQHSLDPLLSTRYGIYDSSGNVRGGALPPNALPIQPGPGGPMVQLYPGQAESAATLAGATAGSAAAAKTPYETTEVELRDGRKIRVPVSAITGTGAPQPRPTPQPGAAPTPNAPTPSLGAGQGQSPAERERAVSSMKSSNDYVDHLRSDAASSVQQNRILDELDKSLDEFTPGKLAAVRKAFAQWKVSAGVASDEEKKVAAAGETGDKITGQLATSAIKRFTPRGTQQELQMFLTKFVPNLELTPMGAKQIVQFMRQANNLDAVKYEEFNKWKRDQPGDVDYRDFDITWNKKYPGMPLTSGQSYPGNNQPQQGMPNAQPNVVDFNQLGRRGR